MSKEKNLAMPVLACLFAALISVGAYIAIPIPGTPLPIVLQNFFIMLAGLLLGPVWGTVAVLVYLALGAAGLPVFAGGTGGLARFIGPSGGYLVGYIPAVAAMGLIARAGSPRRWWKHALAVMAGFVLIYACGLPWLKIAIKGSWVKAIAGGFLPFLPGDALKMVLAVILAGRLAPIVDRYADRERRAGKADADDGGTGD